jgi:hypothetical protein
VPGPENTDSVYPAPTSSTDGELVVTAPLSASTLVPLAPRPASSGPAARPEYSAIRRSGNVAAVLKTTVTALVFAAELAMFAA